jgi:hypothetical protein
MGSSEHTRDATDVVVLDEKSDKVDETSMDLYIDPVKERKMMWKFDVSNSKQFE